MKIKESLARLAGQRYELFRIIEELREEMVGLRQRIAENDSVGKSAEYLMGKLAQCQDQCSCYDSRDDDLLQCQQRLIDTKYTRYLNIGDDDED